MDNNIIIVHNDYIYNIDKEPFETDENTYKRGWFIIKNYLNYSNLKELISNSIINLNENKNNMKYPKDNYMV
jgi:hypothetical protein